MQDEACKYPGCGTLYTSVKDTGEGMTEQTKSNLFRIFGNLIRVSEDSIIRSHGIGLGLSICKELVQFLVG